MSTIADIKRERIEQGLSIRKAETAIGISRGVLNRAESGLGVSADHAKRIANFYGLKVTDIWPVEERDAA